VAGELAHAHTAIEEALEWSDRSEERWFTAELLRIKGELLRLDGSAAAVDAAGGCYRQALDLARRQGALAWELRSATSLARWSHEQGRTEEAHALLSSVYGRFTEGFETADLKIARALMNSFGTPP
jgi:predicted ATPase